MAEPGSPDCDRVERPVLGRALVDDALAHVELARVELRELVRGMLPRLLTRSGLHGAAHRANAGGLAVLPADLLDAADGWSAAGGGVRAPAVVEAHER
jgi:hypothetical protein